MIDSNMACCLPTSQWMNHNRDIIQDETEAIGCKVEGDLEKPYLALVWIM